MDSPFNALSPASSVPEGRLLPAELTIVVPCYNERPNVAVLVSRLDSALAGIAWEAVFVDDDSPDGTAAAVRALARKDPRVRCLRRVGRRGLASAVIEGALSSSADYIAVMDGDLQHDETRLPVLLDVLRRGAGDVAVASRHVPGGDAGGLAGAWRHRLSQSGIRLAQTALPVKLTDPMSGFFMLPRPLFERITPGLTGQGFKILLDLLLSARPALRVVEVPAPFHRRVAGESKLDVLVLLQFAGLLVHLAALTAARRGGLGFEHAQIVATFVAMATNFQMNNVLTYRDQRLHGAALWRGLLLFMAVCGLGALANIGIAQTLYAGHVGWTPAGAAGAAIGLVWNYAVSATLVWGRR